MFRILSVFILVSRCVAFTCHVMPLLARGLHWLMSRWHYSNAEHRVSDKRLQRHRGSVWINVEPYWLHGVPDMCSNKYRYCVESPHLVHNEGLLLIQLKIGYCSTAHNQFNVLVPSYAASQQRSQHNLVYCWQCFWCVVRKSWVFQTYTHPSLIFSTRAVWVVISCWDALN